MAEAKREKNKRPLWSRWLDVVFRTIHVIAMSILFGAAVCAVPISTVFIWHGITIATGLALVISEIYHSRHWFYQARGVMAYFHIGLLGIIHFRPDLILPILICVLVLGMVGSHMPKSFRYWSFVHGRVMD